MVFTLRLHPAIRSYTCSLTCDQQSPGAPPSLRGLQACETDLSFCSKLHNCAAICRQACGKASPPRTSASTWWTPASCSSRRSTGMGPLALWPVLRAPAGNCEYTRVQHRRYQAITCKHWIGGRSEDSGFLSSSSLLEYTWLDPVLLCSTNWAIRGPSACLCVCVWHLVYVCCGAAKLLHRAHEQPVCGDCPRLVTLGISCCRSSYRDSHLNFVLCVCVSVCL